MAFTVAQSKVMLWSKESTWPCSDPVAFTRGMFAPAPIPHRPNVLDAQSKIVGVTAIRLPM